jgi:ATP-dependent exoDNAse (exonuclease V) beta subunit
MLEMIDFDSTNIDEAYSAIYQKYANRLNTDDMNSIKSRVKMLLADEEFMSQITGARLYKELPLSFDGEIKQIDLLAEYEDKMIVFDYKSSTKNHISHQNQVISYKKAIHSLTNKPTFGVIVYLNEENIGLSLI